MLEIVAGVIGKKIVEQAGLCCAIFGPLQSASEARAGPVLAFLMDNRVGRRQFS